MNTCELRIMMHLDPEQVIYILNSSNKLQAIGEIVNETFLDELDIDLNACYDLEYIVTQL